MKQKKQLNLLFGILLGFGVALSVSIPQSFAFTIDTTNSYDTEVCFGEYYVANPALSYSHVGIHVTSTENFTLNNIAVKLGRIGTATDSINFIIRSNSNNATSGTILHSQTIDGNSLPVFTTRNLLNTTAFQISPGLQISSGTGITLWFSRTGNAPNSKACEGNTEYFLGIASSDISLLTQPNNLKTDNAYEWSTGQDFWTFITSDSFAGDSGFYIENPPDEYFGGDFDNWGISTMGIATGTYILQIEYKTNNPNSLPSGWVTDYFNTTFSITTTTPQSYSISKTRSLYSSYWQVRASLYSVNGTLLFTKTHDFAIDNELPEHSYTGTIDFSTSTVFTGNSWDVDCSGVSGLSYEGLTCYLTKSAVRFTRWFFVGDPKAQTILKDQIAEFDDVFPFSLYFTLIQSASSTLSTISPTGLSVTIPLPANMGFGSGITILTSSTMATYYTGANATLWYNWQKHFLWLAAFFIVIKTITGLSFGYSGMRKLDKETQPPQRNVR